MKKPLNRKLIKKERILVNKLTKRTIDCIKELKEHKKYLIKARVGR